MFISEFGFPICILWCHNVCCSNCQIASKFANAKCCFCVSYCRTMAKFSV